MATRPRTLAASAMTLAAALLAASGAPPPARAADAEAGREKARACQTCHGIDGVARVPDAPHIAGESELYLASQLKAFRSGRREHQVMSVIAGQLDDTDIADLAAWYSSIEFTVTVPE